MNIFEFEQLLLAQIDNLVANGSDDELFASGYLRGHISLAGTHTRDVEMSVLRGLQQACLNGELQDADQKLVEAMWQRLLSQVVR